MNQPTKKLRIGCIQLRVGASKTENVANAINKIREAKMKGAELILLPEFFNSLYGTSFFHENAEPIPGETTNLLSQIAKELKIIVIGGSIPERDGNKLYNTATVWGKSGELLAKYRKMHLFDMYVPNEIGFKESDSLSAGNELAIIDIKDFKIGIGICHDIRFEEHAKLYRKKGCNMIVYPSAFNMETGVLLWELVARSRANDNQLFTALISPARDVNASYVAYGHSCVVDPWGKVIHMTGSDEDLFVVDLDLEAVDKVRSNIPIFNQRRVDIYDTIEKK